MANHGSNKPHKLERDFVEFIAGLRDVMANYNIKVVIRTELRRNETIFRAHANYRGKVWRDWVIIDWGDEGNLPCMCWGFVDLTSLPENAQVNYGDCDIEAGVYAIVECSRVITELGHAETSEIFQPISKIVGGLTNSLVSHLKFYMVDIEAFVKPVAVLPDLDGDSNAYFALKDRTDWRDDFVNWLEEPSDFDIIESSDSEESDDNSKTRTGEHSARDGNSSEESDDDEEVSSDASV